VLYKLSCSFKLLELYVCVYVRVYVRDKICWDM